MKAQFYDLDAKDEEGTLVKMSDLKNKVLLIVNTASECGFKNQLSDLETLYQKYKDEGFVILAFPSDNFMNQEPLNATEAKEHYHCDYGVTFPVMEKVDVKGKSIHPLYKYLTEGKSGLLTNRIKWNFTKFLVSREGKIVYRYAPQRAPASFEEDVKNLLRGL
ncbi:glutathione peroxidase [Salinicoccus sp. HZC-1]|uniref:glutathione peroxidase n=1 Tax=Salinicoccus sp. HZC-1 TaxID=3385497 RepID=UPI00398A76CE